MVIAERLSKLTGTIQSLGVLSRTLIQNAKLEAQIAIMRIQNNMNSRGLSILATSVKGKLDDKNVVITVLPYGKAAKYLEDKFPTIYRGLYQRFLKAQTTSDENDVMEQIAESFVDNA